ncbi:hypothetical protein [Thermoactinospora rubra]|uniref:hypothetical protein n=1 Tax=Thermoactinospora rubra TaxID=1088767 RepID=UPI00117FBEBD|nr:hypothetical protein [Thermoactinospora rubra]
MNPPQSWLVIDIRHHWLAFSLAIITPRLSINGQPVPVRWGRNVIPVVPGQHLLEVYVPWIGRMGLVREPLWLQPGGTVELEYHAPLTVFNAGALGPAPQPWPGIGWTIALGVVALVCLLFMLVIIVVAVASA